MKTSRQYLISLIVYFIAYAIIMWIYPILTYTDATSFWINELIGHGCIVAVAVFTYFTNKFFGKKK
jgi:hypothetical protein